MGLGGLLEACQVHRKVALERSSKPTKYEPQGPYGDPVYEPPGICSERNNFLGTSGNRVRGAPMGPNMSSQWVPIKQMIRIINQKLNELMCLSFVIPLCYLP